MTWGALKGLLSLSSSSPSLSLCYSGIGYCLSCLISFKNLESSTASSSLDGMISTSYSSLPLQSFACPPPSSFPKPQKNEKSSNKVKYFPRSYKFSEICALMQEKIEHINFRRHIIQSFESIFSEGYDKGLLSLFALSLGKGADQKLQEMHSLYSDGQLLQYTQYIIEILNPAIFNIMLFVNLLKSNQLIIWCGWKSSKQLLENVSIFVTSCYKYFWQDLFLGYCTKSTPASFSKVFILKWKGEKLLRFKKI